MKALDGDFMLKTEILKRRVNPVRFVVLSFLAVIITGTLLLSLPFAAQPGKSTSLVDALFTATSATCVTGLVVVDIATHYSLFGQIVVLLLIQIGGLGYMTITTFFALLIGQKIHLTNRVLLKESFNRPTVGQIITFTRRVFFSVAVIEIIGAFILFLRWRFLGFWIAVKFGIFHSVSAFNNAGFDVIGNFKSFTEYVADPVVNLTITGLIIIGGLGFVVLSNVYDAIWHKRRLTLMSKIVLLTTIILIVSGTFLIYLFESGNPSTMGSLSLQGKVFGSYFQSVSARTAGFNSLDIGKMTAGGLFVLIILMFIGASPGGTGGGIKTVTFAVLLAAIAAWIKGKHETEVMNRSICDATIIKAMAIFIVSLLLVCTTTLLLCAFNPHTFLQNLFEIVSAFGTVGLSTGITPFLNTASKLTVSFTIFVGRVGVLSLFLMWRTQNNVCKIKLPEEEVSVG